MLSSIDSQSSSLTQIFFMNRFPEPKEDPLLSLKEAKSDDKNTSTSPSSKQQSGIEQSSFSRVMHNTEQIQTQNILKEKINQDSKSSTQQEKDEHTSDAYEQLKIKASYNASFWLGCQQLNLHL